jgi:hypothetical protein
MRGSFLTVRILSYPVERRGRPSDRRFWLGGLLTAV